MPSSPHLKSKRIIGLREWLDHDRIPHDVDDSASLDDIAWMNEVDLAMTVYDIDADQVRRPRIQKLAKRLAQTALARDAKDAEDPPWKHAADVISATLTNASFRAALELHRQLGAAKPATDFVRVGLVKPSGGSITKLHMRLIKADKAVCVPHPQHFSHDLENKEEFILHQTMARLFSLVIDRQQHACHACQWTVENETDVTGTSFTAAAVHAWERMLQGRRTDRHVLIMGTVQPEKDALVPVEGIRQKVEALLRDSRHAHVIDKLVVASDDLPDVETILRTNGATKKYELQSL